MEEANGHERPGPPLRLRLFGILRLERPDGTEIPQPKGGGKGYGIMAGREVLSYLALHRGWVDSETLRRRILGPGEVRSLEQQQASINNGVSHVRTWAQGGLAAELRASLSAMELRGFAIDRDPKRGYRLNSENVWVDVRDFEDAIAEARRSEHPEPALRRALELYTGDLLTNYGRPGNSQREPFLFRDAIGVYLRGDACLAADRLAAILQDKGRPEEALQMVTSLLDGAVCELLERRAMAIEGEASPRGLGDRTRVHKRWQRLRDRLTSELGAGTEPEPATLGTYGSDHAFLRGVDGPFSGSCHQPLSPAVR
ncbi:MAG: AfsR/SARP family transcriptional regulator [Candidatus Rokuibacteriota bacterium]